MPGDKDPKLHEPYPSQASSIFSVQRECNTHKGTLGCFMAHLTLVPDGEVVENVDSGLSFSSTADNYGHVTSIEIHIFTQNPSFLL